MTLPLTTTSSPCSGLNLSRWKVLRQITASMHGVLVLQPEIAMAGVVLASEAGDLAAEPHQPIGLLHRALEREGELRDAYIRRDWSPAHLSP